MKTEQKTDQNSGSNTRPQAGAAQAVKFIGYGAHSPPKDAASVRKFVGYAILADKDTEGAA